MTSIGYHLNGYLADGARQMNFGKIAAISTAIIAVGGAFALFGLDVPKIASQGYVDTGQLINDNVHRKFSGELKSTQEISLENAINIATNRAGDFDVLAIRMRAEGATASDVRVISDQATAYRETASEYKAQLRAVRSK